MAFDAFIWFVSDAGGTPVPGETQDRSFAANNAIQIIEYSWSAENTLTIGSSGGGAGAGKAKLNGFKFKAPVGKQSPVLFKYLATGAHFKTATLVVRSTKNGQPFWQMELGLVFVSGLSQTFDVSADIVVEEWTLMYGSLKETFNSTANSVPNSTSQSWNQVTNSELAIP